MTLAEAHARIALSGIFLTDGPQIDLPDALIGLVDAYMLGDEQYEDGIFDTLGEHTHAPLGDMIVGAFWALKECHAGQESPEYAALCSLGKVYKPGPVSGIDSDDPAWDTYSAFSRWFLYSMPGA